VGWIISGRVLLSPRYPVFPDFYKERTYFKGRYHRVMMKIALSGTPGTGKTTVAESVATKLELTHIDISVFAWKIGAVLAREADTVVVDQDRIQEEIKHLDDLIIDSHFAHVFAVDIVFILRCEPKILFERLQKRGYSKEKITENVMAEILDYCVLDTLDYHAPEIIFEVHENPIQEILEIVKNPTRERSLACGSRTHFLTEENLLLVT
jgi:adenylate kinase